MSDQNLGKNLLACVLITLFWGCSSQPVSQPAPAGATRPTPTPSHTPAPLPPKPTATQPANLDPNGPWLVYQHMQHQDSPAIEVVLTNLDGSGETVLDLPLFYEELVFSPTGPYAAVRVTDTSLPLGEQVSQASLWVISFPEGTVIRRIALVGELAQAYLSEHPPSEFEGLSTTILGAPYLWSPDGRYLAFSGALDGESTDLYIYDMAAYQVVQLTDGSKQAVIHSWSPDSRRIIHEACLFYSPQDRVVYATWAASVDGEVNRLAYGPFNQHPVLGWPSPDILLTYSQRSMGSSDELRMVNLLSGETDFIFNQVFFEAAYDPEDGTILLNRQPVDHSSAGHLPGIYTLEIESGELEMLLPGQYSGLSWQPSFGYFVAVRDDEGLIGFGADGGQTCSLAFQPGDQVSYSPDGQWLVIAGLQNTRIFAATCSLVLQIDLPGDLVWLPDAAGALFFHVDGSGQADIYRYLTKNNWETELAAENVRYLSTPTILAP